jgi:hypothetical protein
MEALHPEHDVLFSSSEVEAMKRPDPTGFVGQHPPQAGGEAPLVT